MEIAKKNTEMNVYNFEVYLCNPKTGEPGWDIQMVSVFAATQNEARESLKRWVPNFDCIILFNWKGNLSHKDMHLENDAYNSGLRFFYTHNNLPTALTPKG